MGWSDRLVPAGTKVVVMDVDMNVMGTGVLILDYDHQNKDNPMPQIRLEDGSIVYGYECWWLPEAEAAKATKEYEQEIQARPPSGRRRRKSCYRSGINPSAN
jgi:hypothetical protein